MQSCNVYITALIICLNHNNCNKMYTIKIKILLNLIFIQLFVELQIS